MSKVATLFLIAVLVLSSLIIVGSVFAQLVSKPSIPEFTLNIENETVVLTIENQPFDVNNSYNYTFYYDVRIKDIAGSWIGLYSAEERPIQSNSNTTVLYYPIEESDLFPSVTTVAGVVIPKSGRARFQVIALIGYLEGSGLVGEVSGWSDSQSIAVASENAFDPYIYVSPETWDTSYKLVLFSPDDQTIYNYTLPLAFILRWTFVPLPGMEPKADYAYRIDDNSFVSIEPNETSKNPWSFSYMLDISNLQEGYHNIVIKATFYQGGFVLDEPSIPFQFIVRAPIPTPTPTPTLTPTPSPTPTPSLEPSPTPTPTEEPKQPEQEIPTGTVFALASIVIFLSLLFYLIKRK